MTSMSARDDKMVMTSEATEQGDSKYKINVREDEVDAWAC